MYSHSTLGITRTALVLTATVVILAVALIVIVIPKPSIPTIQLSGVVLSPGTISQDASATLSFKIQNNDSTKSHLVSVFFDETTSDVTLYIGNQSLTTVTGFSTGAGSSKMQFYHIPQIQPSQIVKLDFKVAAALSGASSTTSYSINFWFTDENLTRFDNETVRLTVLG